MNEKIKRLREQAAAKLHEITVRRDSFDEDAKNSERSEWTDEQNNELNLHLDEYKRLQAQIQSEERIAEVTEAMSTSRGLEIMGDNDNGGLNDPNSEDANIRNLYNWIRRGTDAQGMYQETIEMPIPSVGSLANDDRFKNMRALQTAPNTNAGFNAIRDELARAIVVAQYENDALREAGATVRSTATGSDMPVTTFNDTGNTAPIVAQGAAGAEQDPATGRPVMKAYVYRGYIDVSRELDQDDVVGLIAELPEAVGVRLSRGRETDHTIGTGTNEPTGVLTSLKATASAIHSVTRAIATADATGWTTLIDLYNTVGRAYRRNGRWMMSTEVLTLFLKMKDGDGKPLFLPDVRSDLMVGPFNRPIVVNDNMPVIPAATNKADLVIYGDFRYFWIRDVRAIELVMQPLSVITT